MKVWCEACNGKGYVKLDEYSENNDKGYIGEGSCPYCNGKGYRDQNQPTTEINIDYYEELKAKADKWDERETPKEVIDEDGITFSCPTCYADNSKWIDWSMLQRQPKRAKVCQECGQKLDWS